MAPNHIARQYPTMIFKKTKTLTSK
uniref:Uncharacterized protein n=1 Tax=Anguilla anguilla TaxID=7936 RepID=A0A0E9QNV1_ANGAN